MSNGGSFSYLTPHLECVRTEIIAHALTSTTVTYEELVNEVKVVWGSCSPHYRMGSHLGRISHWEHNHGRPLLSAIIVERDGTVGPGFWKMVEDEMGMLVLDREEYLYNMQQSVFAYWRSRTTVR